MKPYDIQERWCRPIGINATVIPHHKEGHGNDNDLYEDPGQWQCLWR